MAERKDFETGPKGDASATPLTQKIAKTVVPDEVHQLDFSGTAGVRINKPALKGRALRGVDPEAFVALFESVLFDHLPTKLNEDGDKEFDHSKVSKIKPFKGTDNYPNLHDIKRWLDAIAAGKGEKADLELAKTAWATAKERLG